jgi:alkaline phosphatase
MEFMSRLFLPLVLASGLALAAIGDTFAAARPLRGIVFIISDGTSQELLTAARCYAGGAEGRLVMDGYPSTAFVSTFSANDMVTDSAAAATAFSRGIKAENHVIGMAFATATDAPPSLLDVARSAGWSTGTITDDSVTGATPASFEVECPDRNQHPRIAAAIVQQLGARADLVLGGGNKWFHDMSPSERYATGELEVVRETEGRLRDAKAVVFSRWENFAAYLKEGNSLQKPVLGTFYPDVFPYYADGTRTVRLRDMTAAALELMLRDKRPFFLFVEAGLPDKACHQNQAKRAIGEVLELDAMMGLLREKLPQDVLVVASTDHNNGGFSFNGPVPRGLRGDTLLCQSPVTKASTFTWATGPGGPDPVTHVQGSTNDPLAMDHVQPATFHEKASSHTGGDVWLMAEGPGAEAFHGHIDNTQIYSLLVQAMRGSWKANEGR